MGMMIDEMEETFFQKGRFNPLPPFNEDLKIFLTQGVSI